MIQWGRRPTGIETGVYKSEDGGIHWRSASAGLPEKKTRLIHLAMDPRDPKRLFLAAWGYVTRTTDGGEHWQVVKDAVHAHAVVIDPFDSRHVIAAIRTFSGTGSGYPNAFFISQDGGDTWSGVDQKALLQSPGSGEGDQGAHVEVRCPVADPLARGVLYASLSEPGYDVDNGRGVLRSRDGGKTWESMPLDGLSLYRIGTLVIGPTDLSRLYAGTAGNGIFRFGSDP